MSVVPLSVIPPRFASASVGTPIAFNVRFGSSTVISTLLTVVVVPLTVRLPAITVLPVAAATVNLFVLIAKFPVTSSVPATRVFPEVATVNLSVSTAIQPFKDDRPVTCKVEPRVVAPTILRTPSEQNRPLSVPAVKNFISSLSPPGVVSADTYVS